MCYCILLQWYYIILILKENCIKEGKIKSIRLITYCCLSLALLVAGCTTTEQAPGPGTVLVADELERFESAATVDEVRHQIETLPKNTSWWTVNGQDMAWNNKNLNRIFPTVNVYRAGPVRELERHPMSEIADHEVDTPNGKVRFADFLNSDLSTCMGVVIMHRGKVVFEDYPRMEPYESSLLRSGELQLLA